MAFPFFLLSFGQCQKFYRSFKEQSRSCHVWPQGSQVRRKARVQNAQYLSKQLAALEQFEMVNEAQLLPIVALKLKDAARGYTVFDLSRKLRERGWIVPAYVMPPHAEDIAIIRVVVREHFSRDMADILYKDIVKACDYLARHQGEPDKGPTEKKHAIC
ncbi:MAG: hypothetical protein AAFQ08_04070 [Bacteroidota bacterium]